MTGTVILTNPLPLPLKRGARLNTNLESVFCCRGELVSLLSLWGSCSVSCGCCSCFWGEGPESVFYYYVCFCIDE